MERANGPYPIDLAVEYPLKSSRLLALLGAFFLVKGLLLIPHFILLYFLQFAMLILVYIAYWAVLFTGRYPKSLFNSTVGIQRWIVRVNGWLFGWTDRYPPFSFS